MNEDVFWEIISASRSEFDPDLESGNMEKQLDRLYELLSSLKPKKIIGFVRIFHQLLLESSGDELWGAAAILSEGICSADSFDYFLAWLISMGREVYESARQNPDSLADIADQAGIEDVFFEEFASVAANVYAEKTGKDIPEADNSWPTAPDDPVDPAGRQWQKDPAELSRRYPKLWAKFGWGNDYQAYPLKSGRKETIMGRLSGRKTLPCISRST